MSIEAKLRGTKNIALGGVVFTIRKLSPSMFLDKDYLFPMSRYYEQSLEDPKREPNTEELMKKLEEQKDRFKEIIMLSVIKIRRFFEIKGINDMIDHIMARDTIYTELVGHITAHSLGVKKKHLIPYRLIETLPQHYFN